MNPIKSITWDSGREQIRRGGFFGPLLDYFKPKYEQIRPAGFFVESMGGEVITSTDGIEWVGCFHPEGDK